MIRFATTSLIAEFIVAQIAEYPDSDPAQQWAFVKEWKALPLHVGWVQTIAIRPDGEVVTWVHDDSVPAMQAELDWQMAMNSLCSACERYPELRPLLPARTADAADCECRSVPFIVKHKPFCSTCGGLGWVTLDQNGIRLSWDLSPIAGIVPSPSHLEEQPHENSNRRDGD